MNKLARVALASFVAVLAAILVVSPAEAAYERPPLAERVTPEILQIVFPGAERLGPEEGTPPSMAVYQGDEVVGYIVSTLDVVAAPGYSGIAFDVILGVGTDGFIVGAAVDYHHEAYIERDPIRQDLLAAFLIDLRNTNREVNDTAPPPDFVAGATVSARTMRLAVWDSARLVLRARSGRPIVTEPTLDTEYFIPATLDEMVANGAMARLEITNGAFSERLASEAAASAVLDDGPGGLADGAYVDAWVGLANPTYVGRNLLGADQYRRLFVEEERPWTIVFVNRGEFSFRGVKLFRSAEGNRLDRLRLVQGDNEITFVKDDFMPLTASSTLVYGAREAALLFIPEDAGFDPMQAWTLELLAHGTSAGDPFTIVVPIVAGPSQAYVIMPEPELPPAWLEAWTEARVDLIILGSALLVLTLLLAFQHQLTTRFRRFHRWARNGFLLFTLVWVGWIAGAQLSTLHLLNYAMAPFKDFGWAFYLAEPLILVMVVYVVFSLILLGRGVFCGWLCPFGAMQELLSGIARFLRIPRWNPSDRVQSKAWMGKYIAAAGLVIVAIGWPEAEPLAAEVEPFKTAITSMFTRPLPYVGYAVVLLGIGLFTERAYCRFLCPLGGLLAVFDRLHIFTLLKRRPECGTSCQLCELSCPVKAIKPSGEIVMAECFQCLDCQVEYHDDRRCPPLAKKRKQGKRITTARPPIGQPIPAYARTLAVEA